MREGDQRLSILSQLQPKPSLYLHSVLAGITFDSFPVAAQNLYAAAPTSLRIVPFDSFPVAAGDTLHATIALEYAPFDSFPVAATLRASSFLPQKAHTASTPPFDSFPVAAETLTAYPLINLSTANFEVSENLPALPPDTCVGSRKPFPIPGGKREFGRKGTIINGKYG